jgi:ATP-binding protein involved in chromosome partitioning
MAKKLEIKEIGIVENMSGLTCPHCGGRIDLFGAGGGEEEARKLDVSFLGKIPIDLQARTEADKGRPILLEKPDAAISLAFVAMAEKIREVLQ